VGEFLSARRGKFSITETKQEDVNEDEHSEVFPRWPEI
jgi:hypothetical protein